MKSPFIKAFVQNLFILTIPTGLVAIAWTITGGAFNIEEIFYSNGFLAAHIIYAIIFVASTIARWSYLSEKGDNR